MLRLLSVSVFVACLVGGCGSSSGDNGTFDAANQNGTWTGTWTNTTFMSTGAASATVSQTGDTYNISLDLDGGIFGGADPPAEAFTATIATASATLDPKTSAVYGDLTGSLSSGNALVINGTNIPGAVDRFTLSGIWGTTQITANITITFDDTSTAQAEATLTRQ